MPYDTLGLLITLGAGAFFLLSDQPTYRSKIVVAISLIIALLLKYRMPDWHLLGLLFQVAICIGILLYFKYHKLI
jgi:hypothetical protein